MMFCLTILTVSLVVLSGCSLSRFTEGRVAGQLLNKVLSSGTQRRSVLDEIERDEPEYLLDSVFKKNRNQQSIDQNQNQEAAHQLIAEADELYRQGITTRSDSSKETIETLARAGKKYSLAADQWINSTLEQDALFKAGESFFFADYFYKSNEMFERLVKDYPGTRHMDVVQARRFAIAKYWLDISKSDRQNPLLLNWSNQERPLRDTAGNAIRILDQIRLDDPTGKFADDATLALANAYFEKKQYMNAADTYEDLRINFPNSEHQFHAHLFEMKSRLQAYQGPYYDGTHLATADKLVRTIVSQFPGHVEKHRDLLTRENARIRKMKAEREMALGSYYEARGAYQAAGLHYEQVQSEFQNTPVASDAEERLVKISEKPPQSSEPPAWVAKVFPESKPAEPLFGTSLKDQIK
ncbi:MAG: outer membrane protein assembly factor BamD [Planctomycetota bacterium]|nr:outer membrane protein assembly factor BamD [Planctomycetota bacterium]